MYCKTPKKQKARITRIIITAALGILSAGMVACTKGNAAVPNIVTEVLIAQPVQRDVPLQREWVATWTVTSTLRYGRRCPATSSAKTTRKDRAVSKGQVLFEIDPRPFQAEA